MQKRSQWIYTGWILKKTTVSCPFAKGCFSTCQWFKYDIDIHWLWNQASQPAGNIFHNDMFYTILHGLTLFCIVYFFCCVSHFVPRKKIPQKRPTFLDAKEVIATLARSLRQTGRLVSRPFLVLVPQVPTAEGWRKMWLVWLVSNWTPHFVPYEVLQSRNE